MFTIAFKCEMPLRRDAESQAWVVELVGRSDDENKVVAGWCTAYRFDVSADPMDEADSESGDLLACIEAIWDHDLEMPRLDLGLESVGDILVLDHVELKPEYRGAGLGLRLAANAIDVLGAGCAVVALIPGFAPSDDSPDAKKRAADSTRKLRRHWARLGFKMVPGRKHNVMYLALDDDHKYRSFLASGDG